MLVTGDMWTVITQSRGNTQPLHTLEMFSHVPLLTGWRADTHQHTHTHSVSSPEIDHNKYKLGPLGGGGGGRFVWGQEHLDPGTSELTMLL